jgi:KDO2-lipid IV(A) lauroyltransferase
MPAAAATLRRRLFAGFEAVIGAMAAGLLRLLRRFDRKKTANVMAALGRRIGPWLPEHRTGRRNLRSAFPDKSSDEIERILIGVWDNLGRFTADFAHLDRITVFDPSNPVPADIEYSPEALARFEALRASKKPALLFAAHLANWELPALIAHRYGIDAVVLYRRPNLGGVADAAIAIREGAMGDLIPTDRFAPVTLGAALADGRNVGMLVDQYHSRGVPITFFGQPTRANPLLARLVRQLNCPIHGTRIIRLPDNRFRGDVTEAIEPARTADGDIDIAGTMQIVHNVIECWIREYPDQWLWLHRRWRPNDKGPRSKREALALRQAGSGPGG